ncbi:MAG: hypothetical protein EBX52_00530 [Proteobacteria bacterium]|nr:hypothetical protein [Pseudomonadota bacterium]
MSSAGLMMKLSLLPFRRSWVVIGLMVISLAQLMLGLWFCGSLQEEIRQTRSYADRAKMVTIQMKDGDVTIDPIRQLLGSGESSSNVSLEEWKTDDVLAKMEQEEPELVQTVRSIGKEGLQLVPRLLVARGLIGDEAVEKIRLMTEVARVDASPVHHARLLGFYGHLGIEIRIAVTLLLILIFVQFVVFERIQSRDAREVTSNLLAWGVPLWKARFPAFLSMITLSLFAATVSVVEWLFFQKWIWRNNSFLGELSIDHSLAFPWVTVGLTFAAVFVLGSVLVFSGRSVEE